MTDLQNIFIDELKINFTNNEIVLSESNNSNNINTLQEVKITNIDEILFAIKPDTPNYKYTQLLNIEHINKCCDAILFILKKEKHYLLYIEMKSNNHLHLDKKFISSKCYMDYVIELLKNYKPEFIEYLNNYNEIFILFDNKISKQFVYSVKVNNRKISNYFPFHLRNKDKIDINTILKSFNGNK